MKKLLITFLCLSSHQVIANNEDIVELPDTTVTGSSIEKTGPLKLLPIKTVSAEDIKRTGVRTTNDLLKYLPEIDFADYGTQNGLGGAPGTAFIKLRGLSARNTLVLLDGQRLPTNPRQDDEGKEVAVDVNLIPLSAIERIDILKNGSSAVYGSDAVAGVVNIITKRNFQGANLMGNYGITAYGDGSEKQAGFTAGKGDLNRDGYNGMLVFEYFNRDNIYRADRDISSSVDFRRFGGLDFRSSSAPQGNIIDADGNPTGRTERPCPAGNRNGQLCRYDYNDKPSTSLLGTERWNLFAKGSLKLTDTMQFHSQFLYSSRQFGSQNHPIPDIFTLANGDTIRGRFMQGGNRMDEFSTQFYQLSGTLEGVSWGQYWDITAGYGRNDMDIQSRNYFLRDQLNASIKKGLIDPTVTTNNQALVDALKISYGDRSHSSLTFANAKVTGDLWSHNDLNLAYATGFQWRHEALTEIPDEITRTPQIAGGSAAAPIAAARDVFSGFGELKFNLAEQLELQTAVRYDRYSTANNISPQAALVYSPDPRVAIRGSWGQNFLMPTFGQLYAAGSSGAIAFAGSDCLLIARKADCYQPGQTHSVANPNLKPERGESWNVGLDLHPFDALTASFDYWHIEKTNEIVRPNYLDYLRNGGTYRYDAHQQQIVIDLPNVNLYSRVLEGIDAAAKLKWPLGQWGNLTFNDNLTYYLRNDVQQSGASAVENRLGYAADLPTWRNVFSLTWDVGVWSTSVFVRSTAGFTDTYQYPTALQPAPTDVGEVSAYTEADLLVGYRGFKHLDLNMGVKNFTNAMPPFSSAASQRTFGFAYAPLYDNRGAYFFLTANYHFDAPK